MNFMIFPGFSHGFPLSFRQEMEAWRAIREAKATEETMGRSWWDRGKDRKTMEKHEESYGFYQETYMETWGCHGFFWGDTPSGNQTRQWNIYIYLSH